MVDRAPATCMNVSGLTTGQKRNAYAENRGMSVGDGHGLPAAGTFADAQVDARRLAPSGCNGGSLERGICAALALHCLIGLYLYVVIGARHFFFAPDLSATSALCPLDGGGDEFEGVFGGSPPRPLALGMWTMVPLIVLMQARGMSRTSRT
jgi:hypothetical protein